MTTGGSLTGSDKVRKLQTVLHAKAKEEPERRFHALTDKVWRMDFLNEAWARVRRNGGSAGLTGRHLRRSNFQDWSGGLGNCRGSFGREPTRRNRCGR